MELTKVIAVIVILCHLLLASAISSLTFVIDNSGSMEDDINQVRYAARRIVDLVVTNKSSQIKDIVLVTFNDPEFVNKMLIKTRDLDELQSALNSIVAHNIDNHDWPEYALSGIELALKHSEPNSYIFVFTDALAKDYDKVELIKSKCQKARTKIYFVLTDYCNNFGDIACTVYHDIATACSGQVFAVGNNDIPKIFKYVNETVNGGDTVTKSVRVGNNAWSKVEFMTDVKTDHVLIKITGRNVKIGETIGIHDYKVISSTDNNKVYRLDNLAPGKYGFSVQGTRHVTEVKVFDGK